MRTGVRRSAPGAAGEAGDSRAPVAKVLGVAGVLGVLGVLAVTAVGVLTVWAALVGPQQVFEGPGPRPSTVTTTPTPESAEQRDELREQVEDVVQRADPPWWLELLVWGLLLAVLVALLLMLGWGLVRTARLVARRRALPARAEREFEVLEEAARVRRAVQQDAAAQAALLDRGSPRNAVVECWRRFEVQADSAGLAREQWETSSEFALRMLDLVDADHHAVTRLAELYREARFSDHPLGEPVRSEAADALARIHASLGSPP